MWKNALKIIAFCLLVFGMLSIILRICNSPDIMGGGGGWQRFYQAKENSIDVMVFGSSHAHCTVDHGLLWDEYGIAAYTLSAGSQELDSTYFCVREALETQKPKVIMIEMLGAIKRENIQNSDTSAYRNSLGMRWSQSFFAYMKYLSENMDMSHDEKQEIVAKIPIIHTRYSELKENDFYDNIAFMRGYRGSFERVSFTAPTTSSITDTMELVPERLEMLQNIVDYAKSKDVQVLLFASPFMITDEQQMRLNYISEFAEKNDIGFIDFNHMYNEISIDFEQDFRDEAHVNNYGAAKATNYLANILAKQYDVPDRRNDSGYELWDKNALYLRNKTLRYELGQASDINEYLKKLSDVPDNQMIILTLNGNYKALGDVYLEGLQTLGITKDEYETGGAWVYQGKNMVSHYPGNQYNQCMITESGEIHIESSTASDEDGNVIEKANVIINGKDYKLVENGVNIVVYCKEINQIVDVAGDDVYLGLEMTHNVPDE